LLYLLLVEVGLLGVPYVRVVPVELLGMLDVLLLVLLVPLGLVLE
jgi:hypothetical protein